MRFGLLKIDAAATERRLGAEDDVLQHRELVGQHEVLVHHADATVDGVGRRGEVHHLTVDLHRAFVGGLHAVEDFHQGRFPGPVLPADRVDLTLLDGEVDIVVGDDSREAFGDPGQFDGGAHEILPLVFGTCPPRRETSETGP